jgi:hypothetical protein
MAPLLFVGMWGSTIPPISTAVGDELVVAHESLYPAFPNPPDGNSIRASYLLCYKSSKVAGGSSGLRWNFLGSQLALETRNDNLVFVLSNFTKMYPNRAKVPPGRCRGW